MLASSSVELIISHRKEANELLVGMSLVSNAQLDVDDLNIIVMVQARIKKGIA